MREERTTWWGPKYVHVPRFLLGVWRLNGEAARPVSVERRRFGEVTGQVVLLVLRLRSANPAAAAMTACLRGGQCGWRLSWATNLGPYRTGVYVCLAGMGRGWWWETCRFQQKVEWWCSSGGVGRDRCDCDVSLRRQDEREMLPEGYRGMEWCLPSLSVRQSSMGRGSKLMRV